MASNTSLIKKLQKAINGKGAKLLYHTSQWYSDKEDRPITVYSIKQAIWDDEKNKFINKELFSSTSQIQIVLYLRDYWYLLTDQELPTNNLMWNEIREKYIGGMLNART